MNSCAAPSAGCVPSVDHSLQWEEVGHTWNLSLGFQGGQVRLEKNKIKKNKNCGTFKLLNFEKVYKPLQGNVVELWPASEDN